MIDDAKIVFVTFLGVKQSTNLGSKLTQAPRDHVPVSEWGGIYQGIFPGIAFTR